MYRARDPVLKREVAIKVLPSLVSQNPDRFRRFEQEAQAAAPDGKKLGLTLAAPTSEAVLIRDVQ